MGIKLIKILSYLCIAVAIITTLFPYLWIFTASIRPFGALIQPFVAFVPTFENWQAVLQRPGFSRSIVNSILVGSSVALISVGIGSPAAYSFSRFKTGGSLGRFVILTLQMIPPAVLVIPLFLMTTRLGLLHSLFGVIIAHLTFILPLIAWFLIGFFDQIPRELEEQAMVDGCTRFQAFMRIVLPLIAPGLAASVIFAFILSWNEFFYALILTGGPNKTLSVVLGEFWTFRGIELGQMSAAIIVTVLPVLFLSFFVQRHMVRGLARGAIK